MKRTQHGLYRCTSPKCKRGRRATRKPSAGLNDKRTQAYLSIFKPPR